MNIPSSRNARLQLMFHRELSTIDGREWLADPREFQSKDVLPTRKNDQLWTILHGTIKGA